MTLPDDLLFGPERSDCDFTCGGSTDGEICGRSEWDTGCLMMAVSLHIE